MQQAQYFTNSEQALAYLQQRYGSANYNSWQSLRREFWSTQEYLLAGQAQLVFFGDAMGAGGITQQRTNMPKAGSFGQAHFLLKSIQMDFHTADYGISEAFTVDASTIYSDLINGVFQAGVMELDIGGRLYAQVPKPFLYCPPGGGRIEQHVGGINALTLVEGAPNTWPGTLIDHNPAADLLSDHEGLYVVDPNILIEAEQNFQVRLNYPQGALAILATTPITADNDLFVTCKLDGILFRPVQ